MRRMRLQEIGARGEDPRMQAQGDTSAQYDVETPVDEGPDEIRSAPDLDRRGVFRKLGASVTRGGLEAVDETIGFIPSLFGADVNIFRDEGEEGLIPLPEAAEGGVYAFVEGMSQFAVGFAGAGKLIKPLRLAQRTYRGLRGTQTLGRVGNAAQNARRVRNSRFIATEVNAAAAGAVADFVAFDPYDQRLANLMEAMPEAENQTIETFMAAPIRNMGSALAVDEDDGQIVARLKAVVEGGVLGMMTAPMLEMTGRLLFHRKMNEAVKSGDLSPEEARARSQAVAEQPIKNDDPLEILYEAEKATAALNNHPSLTTDARTFYSMAKANHDENIAGTPLRNRSDEIIGTVKPLDPVDQAVPDDAKMWHMTVALSRVMEEGLLSGRKAGMAGEGLGGMGFEISTTWSKTKADYMANTLRTLTEIAQDAVPDLRPGDIVSRWDPDEGMDNPILSMEGAHALLRHLVGDENTDYIFAAGGEALDFETWARNEGLGSSLRYEDAPDFIKAEFDAVRDDSPEALLSRLDEVAERLDDQYVASEGAEGISIRQMNGYLAMYLDTVQRNPEFESYFDYGFWATRPGEDFPDFSPEGVESMLARWETQDLDEVGVIQVAVAKDAPWGKAIPSPTINPPELEIQFDGVADEWLEVVERIEVRSEAHGAALNAVMKRAFSTPKDLPIQKIAAANRAIMKGLEDGLEEKEIYEQLGLNLGLLVKTQKDFTRVSRIFTDHFREEMSAARARARAADGSVEHPENTWEALDAQSQQMMLDALGAAPSLEHLRGYFEETLGPDLPIKDVGAAVQAAYRTITFLGQDIYTTARALDQAVGKEERMLLGTLLRDQAETFAQIQVRMAGVQSETGRALNTFKLRGMSPEEYADAIKRSREKAGLKGLKDVPEFNEKALDDLSKNILIAEGDPEQIRKMLVHLASLQRQNAYDRMGDSFFNKVNRFRTGMMLYGPKTQIINVANNALVASFLPFEKIMGGMFGDPTMRQFGVDQYVGMMGHLGHAFKAMRKVLRTGQNILDPGHRTDEGLFGGLGEFGNIRGDNMWETFKGIASMFVEVPGRGLMAADEFFKQVNYYGHAYASVMKKARRAADEAGLTGSQRDDFIARYTADRMDGAVVGEDLAKSLGIPEGAAMLPESAEFSQYATFTNALEEGTAGKAIQDLVNQHPVFRFIMPFVRTPINLIRFAWERSPGLSLFMKKHRDELLRGSPEVRREALGREAAGAIIWGSAAMLYASDRLTGAGPSNHKLNAQMRNVKPPYSIKLNDGRWISYRRIEPLATALGIVADAAEAANEISEPGEDTTLGQLATAAVAGILSNASQKSFILGLTEFLDAAAEGDPRKVERAMNSVATSFSPNFLNQLNADPLWRESRGIIDEFRRKTPGLSDELEPKRNLFGEPVQKPVAMYGRGILPRAANYANNALNPFTTHLVPENPVVEKALGDLGVAISTPSDSWVDGHIDLRDGEKYNERGGQSPYDRMYEIVNDPPWGGPNLRTQLENFITSGAWEALDEGSELFPGGARLDAVQDIVNDMFEIAKDRIRVEYPSLLRDEIRLEAVKADPTLEADEAIFDFE